MSAIVGAKLLNNSIGTDNYKGLDELISENNKLLEAVMRATVDGKTFPTDWDSIHQAIVDGTAPYYYPIGTIFTVKNHEDEDTTYEVVGHNDIKSYEDETANTMTLLKTSAADTGDVFKECIEADKNQCFINDLPAGNYYFTINTKNKFGSSNISYNGVYKFTTYDAGSLRFTGQLCKTDGSYYSASDWCNKTYIDVIDRETGDLLNDTLEGKTATQLEKYTGESGYTFLGVMGDTPSTNGTYTLNAFYPSCVVGSVYSASRLRRYFGGITNENEEEGLCKFECPDDPDYSTSYPKDEFVDKFDTNNPELSAYVVRGVYPYYDPFTGEKYNLYDKFILPAIEEVAPNYDTGHNSDFTVLDKFKGIRRNGVRDRGNKGWVMRTHSEGNQFAYVEATSGDIIEQTYYKTSYPGCCIMFTIV